MNATALLLKAKLLFLGLTIKICTNRSY